jgi:predicted tellurium resistance membrane protein TerC
MDWITEPSSWIAFGTLTLLEIVLGIDNIIFISILAGKLPADQREKARLLGLGLAMVMRVLLLLLISVIIRLTAPLFEVLGQEISGRDLILIVGGLFLLFKSTYESRASSRQR